MEDKIKKIIEENPLALATIDSEGNPYCIAVAFVKVEDEKLIITVNYMKKTLENIKQNKNISLVVWNKDMEGYQINGEAEYFDTGEWLDFIKKIPENKDEPCRGALVINNLKIKKLC